MPELPHTDILDHLFEGVYIVDRNRKISYWNRAAEELTGRKREEMLGSNCGEKRLRHLSPKGTLLCTNECPLQKAVDNGASTETTVYLQHKDGHRIPVSLKVVPLRNPNGRITGAMELFYNIPSDRNHSSRTTHLEEMALIDTHTNLPNRRFLISSLEIQLLELNKFNCPFGILLTELDHLDPFGEEHGSIVKDRLLKLVADTLKGIVRSNDVVGRYGDHTFAAIITNVDRAGLVRISERFRTMVEHSALGGNKALSTTLSIGAAVADPADSIDSLLKRADEKLYYSKTSGKNRISI